VSYSPQVHKLVLSALYHLGDLTEEADPARVWRKSWEMDGEVCELEESFAQLCAPVIQVP
jgi:hypothetical protein